MLRFIRLLIPNAKNADMIRFISGRCRPGQQTKQKLNSSSAQNANLPGVNIDKQYSVAF